MKSFSRGDMRGFYLSMLVMVTGFMSGYDTGVAGGVLTFSSFQRDFGFQTTQQTQVNSFTVGFQQIGSLLACIAIYPFTARFGRKRAIRLSAVVFLVGIVAETIDTHDLGSWYGGRAVAGVGQGALCVISPMYTAEMASVKNRGRMGSLYQWMFTVGNLLSYWTDYGVALHLAGKTMAWQIPVGLQAFAGAVLLISSFCIPESARWLIGRDRLDEAWSSLTWIRGSTEGDVEVEFNNMKQGIAEQIALARTESAWKSMLRPANRKALMLGSLVFIFQQGTGSTGLAYFAPQFFRALVGSGTKNLFITGFFGVAKVLACTAFILFVADRVGRRPVMTVGAGVMASCMLITGIILKYHPAPAEVTDNIPASGYVTIALIFINIIAYNLSWGPIAWVYVGELFSHTNREFGIALSVAIQWAFSFTFSISTPYMLASMGWGLFVFYAVFDTLTATSCWFIFKETSKLELEGIVDAQQGEAELKAVKTSLSVEKKDKE
ncbi:unnamed protein product [Clonostachys solani]|uniref:Major facilitator superfamily (MFS) profile domain-containing protein n=1 Tax=Clonostachys solani TaxID=160281 RepID=A0A9P0EPE2_9HYPO|nr:unnamed protein product [Clonostachys solani]